MKQVKKLKSIFPLTLWSNGTAILVALISLSFFMPKPTDKDFGTVLAIGIATSWLLQTWIFKMKNLRESQFVDHKWYKKTYKLSPKQLDEFIAFNYRISTFIKVGVVVLTFIHPRGREICPGLFFGLMMISFMVRALLVKLGRLKAPKGNYKAYGSPLRHTYNSPYAGGIDYAYQLATGIIRYRNY